MTLLREAFILILCTVATTVLSAGQKLDPRTRIAIFDTGIMLNKETRPWLCSTGNFDATGTGLEDREGHGTNVAGLITKYLDITKYCLVIIKYYHLPDKQTNRPEGITYADAWNALLKSDAKYVNISISGDGYSLQEYKAIKTLVSRGVKVVVSAGNHKMNFNYYPCTIYPACYKMYSPNFYVVGAKNALFSNYNGPVKYYENGIDQRGFGVLRTGSSQATANFTNKLIRGIEN